ncbi:MAG: hypothetical protein EOM23_03520 [Candidatus Moranbacteria bacterium]|nr:hypothetical protein [Candidatus Moranbacteria bacterium]
MRSILIFYEHISREYETCMRIKESLERIPNIRVYVFSLHFQVLEALLTAKQNYIEMVSHLHEKKALRNLLSQNAKKYAMSHFSIEKMVRDWENLFDEILTLPKTIKQWESPLKSSTITPKDIFLESLGEHGKAFIAYLKAKTDNDLTSSRNKITNLARIPSWQADTRGTAHHYNSFFKEDRYLSIWSQLMKPKND